MNEHEKWLSRRLYHETFSTRGKALPSWGGVPNRCNCGCAGVWYDRLSPTNWWTTLNPAAYILALRRLVNVFAAFHGILWHIPPVIWGWSKMVRAGYMREVLNRIQPSTSATIAQATARLVLYGIIVPLTVVVWATVWIISRPGIIPMAVLYFATIALIATVLMFFPIIAVIAISMSGLVFIIGGLGSILYLDNPAIGIIAIAIGVFLQYELNRRERRRREEQLGYVIQMLESQTKINP